MKRIEQLEVETVSVTELVPHPRNPRIGDVPAIAESLRAHGQFRPLVVQQSTGFVLDGNHTLLAAVRLGWPTVKIVRVDVDDDQALRILLAANRTSDLATYHETTLSELLEELRQTTDETIGTAYDSSTVDRLLADATREARHNPFARFGEVPDADESTVAFRFGDYAAQMSMSVYERFVEAVEKTRRKGVLRLEQLVEAWLR